MAYQPHRPSTPSEPVTVPTLRTDESLPTRHENTHWDTERHHSREHESLLVKEPKDSDDYQQVPYLKQKLHIDDHEATYVIVFPRQKDRYGDGTVDPFAERENPKADWERIFNTKRVKPPASLKGGTCSEAVYQEEVRNQLKDILRESGLKATATESVDKDEVFVKVTLDAKGEMIKNLAETFQYKMPFKHACYQSMDPFGIYPGRRPMKNASGFDVPAYKEYDPKLAEEDKFQCFRQVDQVRLITSQLATFVRMEELVAQNIIARHFPAAHHASVVELNATWADWPNLLVFPSGTADERIRNYFGEEIAFFFLWIGMYTKMLLFLGLIGVLFELRKSPLFLSLLGIGTITTESFRDKSKASFGVIMVMWETVFHKMFKAESARAAQLWGMKGFERMEDVLPMYNPELDGTQRQDILKSISSLAVIVYMAFSVWVIYVLNNWFYNAKQKGEMESFWSYQPYLQSAIIKVLSFTWRRLAFYLVNWQNHRTQSRWNHSMVLNLSIVKIFVALYPFVYTAFLKTFVEATCEDTLSESAWKIYGSIGWPVDNGLPDASSNPNSTIPVAELSFLKGYHYIDDYHRACILGCYPVECKQEAEELACTTNCDRYLEASLNALYLIQVSSCMVFIAIPIVLTRWAVNQEIDKAKRQNDGGPVKYTFIQLQAKCHKEAWYGFQSWGGSYVEDFLDMAVGYALLACFGILTPTLPFFGFICMMGQYRLLAHRMTNVTCRPDPRGADGIGLWEDAFEIISYIAVVINAGVVVRLMLPMRNWDLWEQAVAFVIAEKALFLAKGFLSYFMPDTPDDVVLIEDFNDGFLKKLVTREECRKEDMHDYSKVDIGLARDDQDSGASSSDE